ncbi:MAG: DUF4349 domain-containing protein [Caldilineales bacterium]|nr:DUF4349 domain-containing protein [Caldilineales bacterium]
MKRAIAILILITLVLAACASGGQATADYASAPMPGAPAQPEMEAPAAEPYAEDTAGDIVKQAEGQNDRKVIYNSRMDLVVEDTEAVGQQIGDLADSLGGFISGLNAFRGEGDQVFVSLTLRIPAEQFETARAALRGYAMRVENESINTNDVTDQYYDINARLTALRATETELLALLAETRERNGDVEDIMSIYRELTNIQGQIESLQGQLNRLENEVSLSTIDVVLRPDELTQPITTRAWRPLETLRNSFRTLLSALQGLIDVLIYVIVVALPVLLILAIPLIIIVLIIRWLVRRSRRKNQNPTD